MIKFGRALSIALALLLISFTSEASNEDKTGVFAEMKSLIGLWQKEGVPESKFSVLFELTANDTILVETWLYNGKKHSLTLYHLNGKNLMATHYCPQGNQPRLQLTQNSIKSNLFFEYLDATNLQSLDDSHQHALSFDLSDVAHKIQRKEMYKSKSSVEISELVLVRKTQSANKPLKSDAKKHAL